MKLPSSSSSLPAVLLLLSWHAAVSSATSCINSAFARVPACAQSCLLSGAASVGCGATDFVCQCERTAALFAAADSCVSLSCPAESYQGVIDGVDLVCECIAPVVLRRQGGTASVSGTAVGSVTAPSTTSPANTATATSGGSGGGLTTTAASSSGAGGGQGNGATWTGYTSVSDIATASAVGAAARPTLGAADVARYVVPVAMAGAALF